MSRKVVKFFAPKVETGWHKNQKPAYRRRLVLKAHRGDLLASGRAMQSLANVSQDSATARKAKQDADYFFRLNAKRNK